MLKPALFAGLLLLSTLNVSAQSSIIERFTALQKGNQVYLKWKIGKGNSCIDMVIQRSTDGHAYGDIGTFEGLCGSDDSDSWYDWTDEGPLEDGLQYHYRIWASNGTVISEVRLVSFRNNPNQMFIYYEPGGNSLQVTLNANSEGPFVLSLFNLAGQNLQDWSGLGPKSSISIPDLQLPQGVYVLQLRDDQHIIKASKISF